MFPPCPVRFHPVQLALWTSLSRHSLGSLGVPVLLPPAASLTFLTLLRALILSTSRPAFGPVLCDPIVIPALLFPRLSAHSCVFAGPQRSMLPSDRSSINSLPTQSQPTPNPHVFNTSPAASPLNKLLRSARSLLTLVATFTARVPPIEEFRCHHHSRQRIWK